MSDNLIVPYHVLQNDLLLSNILSFLDVRSLYQVQTVTTQWYEVSKQIIKRRQNFVQIFKTCNTGRDGKINPRLIKLHPNWDSISDELEQETKNNLWYPLKFGILLNGPCSGRNTKAFKIANKFRECLPLDSQFLHVISRSGIIGWNNSDGRSASEVQATVTNSAGISFLLWPDIGIDAQIFTEGDSVDHLLRSNGCEDLKGLIVFTRSLYDDNDHIMPFPAVEKISTSHDNKLAIGGLVVQHLTHMKGKEEASKQSLPWVAIALSGKQLSMASCVLLSESIDDLRLEMERFKSSLDFAVDGCDPNTKTVCILLACNGRGGHMFGEANQEVDVFASVFPNVRLTGMYGDGEFGLDHWPKGGNPVRGPEEWEEGSQWWHFYSSILILISVKIGH